MNKRTATILLGLAAQQAMAQTSVVSLFFVDTDSQSLVASVINAGPTATTYQVSCPPGTDSDDCGIPFPGATVTAAPSAWDFNIVVGDASAFSESAHCDMTSFTIPGTCTEIGSGTEANDPGTSIYVPQSTDFAVLPVTITAGLEKLASATMSASATSGGSSSGSAKPASSASATGASGAKATGASSTGSAASSASTAQATGAAAGSHEVQLLGAMVGVGAAVLML